MPQNSDALANQSSRLWSYADARYRVIAASSDQQWLGEFLRPAFDSAADVSADASGTISLVRDRGQFQALSHSIGRRADCDRDCFTLDGSYARFSSDSPRPGEYRIQMSQPRGVLLANPGSGRWEIVCGNQPAHGRMALMKCLRELVIRDALLAGWVPFHGAAAMIDGEAVCFLGARSSGKTTSLIHALQSPGTRFLSNDRFFVRPHRNGFVVRGLPTILRIRSGTLDLFPELGLRIRSGMWQHAELLTEAGRTLRSASQSAVYTLNQSQFCKLARVDAATEAPLAAFVFPQVHRDADRSRAIHIHPEHSAGELFASLLRPCDPWKHPAPFHAADEAVDDDALRRACRELARLVPCYRSIQGPRLLSAPWSLGRTAEAA